MRNLYVRKNQESKKGQPQGAPYLYPDSSRKKKKLNGGFQKKESHSLKTAYKWYLGSHFLVVVTENSITASQAFCPVYSFYRQVAVEVYIPWVFAMFV